MRRFAFVLGVLALAACDKDKKEAPSTATPPAAAPAPINLASLAGMWAFKVTPMTSDSVLLTYTLNATADTSGWTLTFPGRPAIPLHVTAAGDSVVAVSPQYESVLRKGVKVWTTSVMRVAGDTVMLATIAHYDVKTADSVASLRGKGTKMPM